MTTLSDTVRHLRRLAEVKNLRDWTDPQLLERFTLNRDETAFAELVRRHGPMVFATCRRVLRHEQDAEDAFQAAFLVLARKAGAIRERDSVAGWLYQVAHRLALRARSAGDRRRNLIPLNDVSAIPAPTVPADPLAGSVSEQLDRLPEQYRTALVLCYLEGRSQNEAARLLATTADAVNSRLKRARDLLRQRLVRGGLAMSSAGLMTSLASATARAALPPALVRFTTQAAVGFISKHTPVSAAVILAKGALHAMISQKIKHVSALAVTFILFAWGTAYLSMPVLGDGENGVSRGGRARNQAAAGPKRGKDAKRPRSCIILWMSGGPSQIDTFDPKPGSPNAGLFTPIDTAVKGVQFSQHLPILAKHADKLAVVRSLTHGEGNHGRGTYLMRTGHTIGGGIDYPALGCVLGKELGESRPDLPRYLSVGRRSANIAPGAFGPGFLGEQYTPIFVAGQGGFGPGFSLPPADAFEAQAKGRGEKLRKAVEKAFDLTEEKQEVRAAYGPDRFGQGCLLTRRLAERGVPVVEVGMDGWDTHGDNFNIVNKRSAILDSAFGTLLTDLHKAKRLDSTLIVWMGEFGRTPRINVQMGRDHWPRGFCVVLAGCGIKGGQAIGKTDMDGVQIVERPVSPAELHATIYQALGIDPAKEYTVNDEKVPIVDAGTRPVKEALR